MPRRGFRPRIRGPRRPGRIIRNVTRNAMRRRRRYRRRRTRRWLVGGAVLLALSGTHNAYKIQDRDVEKLEKHYGRPADELSEQEVVSGMQTLGIEKNELNEEDRAKVYKADSEDEDFKSSGTRYCMQCGELLKPGGSFCPSCGSRI
ncbi:MAG: zinc ribbon domain-containing protein [Candidatus Heimdallarchaeota archaeon]